MLIWQECCFGRHDALTAVQLVFNPFSQFVPHLELYSQLKLSLWSDPLTFPLFGLVSPSYE